MNWNKNCSKCWITDFLFFLYENRFFPLPFFAQVTFSFQFFLESHSNCKHSTAIVPRPNVLENKAGPANMGYLTKWLVEWPKLPTTTLPCQKTWQHVGYWLMLKPHHASGLSGQTYVLRAINCVFQLGHFKKSCVLRALTSSLSRPIR